MGAARAAGRWLVGHPVALTSLWALACALAVEAAPVVGGDLAAQSWWRSWATSGVPPVDLGWYGGVPVVSYSFAGPWIAGLLGLPLMGVLGTVLGAAATTALLARLRPSPGRLVVVGLVAGLTWAADEWSGRTTFGLGAALGCLALVLVSRSRPAGALLAVLAGAVSPVAAVFLLLAAGAWIAGTARRASVFSAPAGAWWIAGGALVPVAAARLLGAVSGPQPFSAHQMLAAVAAAALTGLLIAPVTPQHRVLRVGAALTVLLLVGTWLVHDPVGSNSTRLVLLFAAPALVAAARTVAPVTALAAIAVVVLLPPVVGTDLVPRDPAPEQVRATALVHELTRYGPVGRIEVVPLHDHEESVAVARAVPLARGWLRQLDTSRAALFYGGSPSRAAYLRWLRDSGVSYVALPTGQVDWEAHGEARLLHRGVPGLQQVWSDRWWRVFRVTDGGLVRGDARLVTSDRSHVVLDVRRPGSVQVAVWWSRWTSVSGPGGCVEPGSRRGWTTLAVTRPGRYVLSSSWEPAGRCT
ncbi:hypothetical protein [Petropleomorpha daqingensis]|uniref:4-amino-4-deoxy-L-arabinose transferase n=1 Tax=Petropleomorpha daqingensis TaxID=2026353 RepID=A0A853CGM6_9ACTN|nr:hypothetical protein [Petropleomorpha daqingensis]NYJ07104.1 hypothetical protein [Petropleomorpha daqingensis]